MSETEREKLENRLSLIPRPPTSPTCGDLVFLATYNENLLDKELKLANDRIGWMMTSQSILLGAFCLLYINKNRPQSATQAAPPSISPDSGVDVAASLLPLIPFVALAIVIAGLIGFGAAQIVIHTLETERTFYQAALSRHFSISIPDIGCNRQGRWLRKTRKMGYVPSLAIMGLLILLWGYLLLTRLNMAIGISPF